MIKKRWVIAVIGSILLHCVIMMGIYYALEHETVSETVYMEVSMAELFQPQTEMSVEEKATPNPPIETNPQNSSSVQADNQAQTAALPNFSQTGGVLEPVSSEQGTVSVEVSTGTGSVASQSAKPSGTSRGPKVIYSQEPVYPERARLNGWEGTVRLRFIVNTQGTVDEVTVVESSGHREIDQAAIDCIKQWRFSPALKTGVPIAAVVTLPVSFDLR